MDINEEADCIIKTLCLTKQYDQDYIARAVEAIYNSGVVDGMVKSMKVMRGKDESPEEL